MSDSQDVLLRQLQQLKELRDSGALTQEGFEKRAAELLSGAAGEPRSPSTQEGPGGDSGHWSASPKPGGSTGRWEAKPSEKTAVWSTPVATVTADAPAPAEAKPLTRDKPEAASSAETPVQSGDPGPSSPWSAAPDALVRLPDEAVSVERKLRPRGRIEEEPVRSEPERSVSAEPEITDEGLSPFEEPIAAAPVSKKERRRWLRRDPNTVTPVEVHEAAAPADAEAVFDRGEEMAPVDERPGSDSVTAAAVTAAVAEHLSEQETESAPMSVSEAAPDSAAIENVAALAGVAKEEPKERRSWWRRGLVDPGSPVAGQKRVPSGQASTQDQPGSRSESDAGPRVAEDLQERAGTERTRSEGLSGVEQPFQRDLRWRRQSFLPAKWDEVHQGARKGSYWDSSSRVVPPAPEADSLQDQAPEDRTKAKSTYWGRNRKRD